MRTGDRVMTPDGLGTVNQAPARRFTWVRFESDEPGILCRLREYPNEQLMAVADRAAIIRADWRQIGTPQTENAAALLDGVLARPIALPPPPRPPDIRAD